MMYADQEISLSGDWKVLYDEDNRGRYLDLQDRENFFKQEDIQTIHIPSCLEEFRQDYEGVAWYYKSFFLPAELSDKVLRISFDAVNYRCEVWVNGYPVGTHEGGYTGFDFDMTAFVKFGEENDISVRVITPLITRDVIIDGLARDDAPHWRGAIAGGIWQDVRIKISGVLYMDEIFIQPHIQGGTIDVSVNIVNMSLKTHSSTLSAAISPWRGDGDNGSSDYCIDIEPGENAFTFTHHMGDFKLWSCDSPYLYILDLGISAGEEPSEIKSIRFGMREFTIEGTSFILNGEKIILKGAFYEGLYPHSLAYPRDLEVLRKTLEHSKDAGLNVIRPWRKQQPPVVYDMADEMGLLFVGSVPIECMQRWPSMTPSVYNRMDNEIKEMVLRDRNHPSIIMWEMFNEIWRLPLKQYKHKASLVARYNDPARIILDEAGGFAGGASIYMPYSKTPTVMNDVHHYPRAPFDDVEYENFLKLARTDEEIKSLGMDPEISQFKEMKPGVLTNISEIGYGSVPNLGENMARYREEGNVITPDYRIHERLYSSYNKVLNETGIMEMFGSLKAFEKACQTVHANGNKFMIESCRLNENIGGIMVHALTDGDWVVGAGMLDLFGDPKESFYGVKKGFANRYIAIRTDKVNLLRGETLEIDLKAVNDDVDICGVMKLSLTDEEGREKIVFENREVNLIQGISSIAAVQTDSGDLSGMCTLQVELICDGEIIAENDQELYVLEPFDITKRTVCLIDSEGVVQKYTDEKGIDSIEFSEDMDIDVPLFVTRAPEKEQLDRISRWVENGGKAVIMDFPKGERMPERIISEQLLKDYLPFEVITIQNQDLWSPSSHIARKHTVFDGLPVERIMDNPFKNILPRQSIVNFNENWISGAVYYTWFASQEHKQNYRGVDMAEHGSDIVEVPYGKGAYILNTMRLSANMLSDRIAQALFNNMAEWM